MDFRSLLSAAQQNVSTREKSDKFYSTKFAPPKKSPKEKKLSDNIKKFLEKQKEEEEEKARAARQKKLELLARRDPKEQRKIDKTLKVIKSSKKYYTGDKDLDENTEITMQNPYAMPDDDDYGYVSKTSEALHLRLMEKYKKMPEDNKFSSSSNGQNGKSSKVQSESNNGDNFHFKNGSKTRVSKIKSEKEPASKKVPTSTSTSADDKRPVVKDKPKPKFKPPPPAINFEELLKLAAQKQHEDIVIDVPTAKKEPERLLTLKEKKEMEELEAARKAKLMRAKEGMNRIPKLGAPKNAESSSSSLKHDRNNNDKEKAAAASSTMPPPKMTFDNKKKVQKPPSVESRPLQRSVTESIDRRKLQMDPKPKSTTYGSAQPSSSSSKSSQDDRSNRLQSQKSNLPSKAAAATGNNGAKLRDALSKPTPNQSKPSSSSNSSTKQVPPKVREFPPKDLLRTREFPPRDLKRTREFPPRDMRRPPQQNLMSKKRRIVDEDDDDSEYDSDLDDFIDDGEEDFNYSNEIQKIFGYNKTKYRDEDFDDREMESDYRTVMREEFISKKLGLMEDLEDMRMEAEEKKQKDMMKKRKR